MKTKLSFILGGMLLISQVPAAHAVAQTLTVSAAIPAATGLLLTVTPINGTTGVAGTPSTTATTIPFGTLTYNATSGIYLPVNYYSVAIGTSGGAGTPIVAVTYTEGTNPNGASNGLGVKTVATFVTANPVSNVETVSSLGKKRLIDLTGTAGELSTIPTGQYEKVYVGVWTGNPSATPLDPTNGQPFTNGDAPGTYTGTLTFTAVTL